MNSDIKVLEYIGYDEHSCETWYKCPFCNKEYGNWSFVHKQGINGWFNIPEDELRIIKTPHVLTGVGFICDCGQKVAIPE